MIRPSDRVFVDTGAWVALAVVRDPLHPRAREQWEALERAGSRLFTSVPVLLETFTFLDRKGSRLLANRWRESLGDVAHLDILDCVLADLNAAWSYVERKEFHKLSLVDATSFVLMRKHKIRMALAFDTHFTIAGFRFVG